MATNFFSLSYVYVYIDICIYMSVYIYIYVCTLTPLIVFPTLRTSISLLYTRYGAEHFACLISLSPHNNSDIDIAVITSEETEA